MKRNRKWKIPQKFLEIGTSCFSSYKCEWKVKLWWVGARERKKRTFFVPFILSKRIFFISSEFLVSKNFIFFIFYLFFLCLVYWTHTFTYQKSFFHTLFCLLLKPLKAFSVSLKWKALLILFDNKLTHFLLT